MSADARESAYYVTPIVTPERQASWERWRDNYLAHCAERWITQGADRDAVLQAAAVVWLDLAQVDELAWMPLGPALQMSMERTLFPESDALQGDAKTEYINSVRTIETSTEQERALAVAYHLGVNVSQAVALGKRAAGHLDRDPEGDRRTALYRHFDEAGRLLYVGIATDPGARSEQHRYHSKWFRFVANTQTEWLPTREAAEVAERGAIGSERPIFNQTHNRANRAAAIDYLYGELALSTSAAVKSA